MGFKQLKVAGVDVGFRNMPGSAMTRVSIEGKETFGFAPGLADFVTVVEG